jgi:hypothetical protein
MTSSHNLRWTAGAATIVLLVGTWLAIASLAVAAGPTGSLQTAGPSTGTTIAIAVGVLLVGLGIVGLLTADRARQAVRVETPGSVIRPPYVPVDESTPLPAAMAELTATGSAPPRPPDAHALLLELERRAGELGVKLPDPDRPGAVWVDRDGIAERMLSALHEERTRRGLAVGDERR